LQSFAAAPWPTALKVTSGVGTALLIGVWYGAGMDVPVRGLAHWVGTLVTLLPPALLLGAALFVVQGYEVDAQALRVRRLLWSTLVPLAGLTRVWQDPQAIKRSIKIFGNGGLFAFTGLYKSDALGRYRLYATDPARAVIVQLPDRTVVVTPAYPHAFVQYLSQTCLH
jgi:hypothetical protein